MKIKLLTKSIIAFIFVAIFSFQAQAASPKSYIYDTKEVNGQIIAKTIFSQKDGLLNKTVKYEFTYNQTGQVASKKAFRWSNIEKEWTPYYLIAYSYENENEINSIYNMWNPKKKAFNLNTQEMNIPIDNYNEIFK